MPKLTIDELQKMRETTRKGIYLREGNFRGKVIVHMGTCGIAAGAREIMNTFLDESDQRKLTDIMFTTSGCAGLCSEEPIATIEMKGSPPVKYRKLTSEKVKKIFNEHIMAGKVVKEFVLGIGSERVG
ncbi:MAG: (2Fe-2S) ferredoxin domain-containing protein [Bacteroidetes bacterium]|nr:(2Fe-2S) ferredoxin domain-containing protein [Bacteroidota bacterium]